MLLNNRYRVLQTLGSGGFGDTFLAEDTQMPSLRRCVIKQLKPIHHNSEVYQLVQARFQREAAVLEELGEACEQIPKLYAYFQEGEKFFLVQEWIEGDTLSGQFQKQGIFSELEIRNLLVDLLPVLNTIHARGIIHRDIKPDNVILRTRDSKPVLIDFGAVRESMGTVINSQGSPTSSIVIGTPGFMSSEQAMGRPVFVSDIYSLGVTAIYLITGRQPQELPTDPRTGEIVWHNYAPNISPQLRDILEKATAYHPRDRFNNALEMLGSLQGNFTPGNFIPGNFTPGHFAQAPTSNPTVPIGESTPTVVSRPPVTPLTPHPNQQTLPNTIPVSPVNPSPSQATNSASIPQVQSGSSNKTILISSIIAAGLIGAAGIISFALNRQPNPSQNIAQQENNLLNPTTPETDTTNPVQTDPSDSSNSSSNFQSTPSTPSNRNTSRQPSTRETPPSPSEETSSATTSQTPLDQRSETPIVPSLTAEPTTENPVDSETSSENTPTAPTPTTTPTPIASAPNVSPVDFVGNYYANINNGNLETSWNQLSQEFRNNRRLHPKGFVSYEQWWGQTVASVNINQLSLLESNNNSATVVAKLDYNLENGEKSASDVKFYLVWDTRDRRWVIQDAQRLRG